MRHRTMLLVSLIAIATASTAAAQNALPTYQGDPDVYKLIFEDQNFRVIAATWKKGTTDKAHSHPAPLSLTHSTTALFVSTIRTARRATSPTRRERQIPA
jgi:hypothetical protein